MVQDRILGQAAFFDLFEQIQSVIAGERAALLTWNLKRRLTTTLATSGGRAVASGVATHMEGRDGPGGWSNDNARVTVTGKIELYKGRPEIVISSSAQIGK